MVKVYIHFTVKSNSRVQHNTTHRITSNGYLGNNTAIPSTHWPRKKTLCSILKEIHRILLQNTTALRYIMACNAMLSCVMVCYVMLCYVMLCCVMSCYVMLCYVILCYVMLRYVMLCHVMSCNNVM
jgi:hypothetical protein